MLAIFKTKSSMCRLTVKFLDISIFPVNWIGVVLMVNTWSKVVAFECLLHLRLIASSPVKVSPVAFVIDSSGHYPMKFKSMTQGLPSPNPFLDNCPRRPTSRTVVDIGIDKLSRCKYPSWNIDHTALSSK